MANADVARRIGPAADDGPAAEAELCRRFWQRSRLYGLKHLRDVTAAEDLAQQVMEIVIGALRDGRVNDVDRIDQYVMGVCRNVAKTAHRDVKRSTLTQARLAGEPAPPVEPPWHRTCLERLTYCYASLAPRDQSVVLMTFQDQLSSADIARALSISVANVRVIRHRAVHALRECLDAKGGSL